MCVSGRRGGGVVERRNEEVCGGAEREGERENERE